MLPEDDSEADKGKVDCPITCTDYIEYTCMVTPKGTTPHDICNVHNLYTSHTGATPRGV